MWVGRLSSVQSFSVLLFLSISSFFYAQSDSTVTDTGVEIDTVYRRFRVAINYSSANTMLGKRDSIPIPILSPTIKYTTSKDFFYQVSLVHSNTTSKMFDEVDLKLGKSFYFGDRWDASVSYTRYIFSKEVDRLSAVVNNDINAYVGFDWTYVYTGLSLDYTTGKKTVPYHTTDTVFAKKANKYVLVDNSGYTYVEAKDFTMTLMNSKQFYFYEVLNENDRLIITPEIDVMYGTQNGVETSATTKKIAKGKGKYTKSTSTTTKTNTPFLAYVFNLDFRYTIKRFTFNFSPYYTIPQNISAGAASSPYFVAYGGVFYTIKWPKL
jgi:hypothetical protein